MEQYCELKTFCVQRIIKNLFSFMPQSTQCPSFPLRVKDPSTTESGSSKTHYSAESYKYELTQCQPIYRQSYNSTRVFHLYLKETITALAKL